MSKKSLIFLLLALISMACWSDNIANYQSINQSIPKMEIKADEQSQAWARSARHVLAITNESIAETLVALNKQATQQGRPFFCLPNNVKLNAELISKLIDEASKTMGPSSSDNQLTVSQFAYAAVVKKYPCKTKENSTASPTTQAHPAMQHGEAVEYTHR